jgi:hypothetical protein
MVLNIVITIVNYDHHMFIVQATEHCSTGITHDDHIYGHHIFIVPGHRLFARIVRNEE